MNSSTDWTPKSKATAWCLAVSLGGALLAITPFFVGASFGQGRFSLVLIGALACLTALCLIPYFRNRSQVATDLLDETQLLAHWTLSEHEWTAWMSHDESAERRLKWRLFGLIFFFCLVIGAVFVWGDPKAGPIVLGVLLCLCALIAIIIPWTLRSRRLNRLKAPREVRICANGLRLGEELHVWHGFSARLEQVAMRDGPPCLLEIVYSTRAKNQRQFHEVRVPVPHGKNQAAVELAGRLDDLRPR